VPFVPLDELVRRAAPADPGGPLRCVVTARVVYEGYGTPRQEAAVALFEDEPGRLVVTAVGPRDELLAAHPRSLVVDAGYAVSPAPVNAHTHLDLSDMPYTPGGYEDFLRAVIAHGRAGARGASAARRGLAEVKASGVRVVGDTVTDPAVMELLLGDPDLTGVAYWEVIGPDPDAAEEGFARAVEVVNRFRSLERPGGVRVGVSPHTPHTVSAPLLRRVASWARAQGLPVAIHVAETPAERELWLRGTGLLAAALASWGHPVAPVGASPVRYLDDLGALEGGPTLVHMVAVDDEDVRLAQAAGCAVVHCPRSNASLGCGRFPWETFARHGVDVAIGTDSRGSSPDLDVVAEALAAAELHGERASPRAVVRAAVKGGYRALGLRPPRVSVGAPAAALGAWT
jgi:cytosine/adenosine deaminase-related metal-dependent hydrolase